MSTDQEADADLTKENTRLRSAIARILEADEEGDGHEMIHALRDARALLDIDPPQRW